MGRAAETVKTYTLVTAGKKWGAFKGVCANKDVSIKTRLGELIDDEINEIVDDLRAELAQAKARILELTVDKNERQPDDKF